MCIVTDEPTLESICSTSINELYTIPNFCAKALDVGNADTQRWCQSLSDPINGVYEWSFYGRGDSCTFNPGTTTECLSGGIAGRTGICQRSAFLADKLSCCKADYDLNPGVNNSNCFQKNGRLTCDPQYRGLTKTGCQDLYLDYCVEGDKPGTDPLNSSTYTSKWYGTGTCASALQQNGNNVIYTQQLLGNLYKRYFETDGFKIANPGESGYNTFQNRLLELSNLYPGGATPYLETKLCPRYSRETLSTNFRASQFCGCHLPVAEYANSVENKLGVPIQCDPLCTVQSAVPRTDTVGAPIRCSQTICIINDVSLNLTNSNVGQLSFNQLCGNCGSGSSCTCSIVDLDINADNSQIGNINLKQNCTTSNCYVTDPATGNLLVVNCNDTLNGQQNQAEAERNRLLGNQQTESDNQAWRITAIILAVIILALIIIALILTLRA